MNILRDLRIANNLKQYEIAKYLSYSKSSYGDFEKKGTTNIYVYIKLAYLYDVNIGYLLGITKNIVHLTEEEKKIIALKYNVNNYLKDKIGIINYDIPRK